MTELIALRQGVALWIRHGAWLLSKSCKKVQRWQRSEQVRPWWQLECPKQEQMSTCWQKTRTSWGRLRWIRLRIHSWQAIEKRRLQTVTTSRWQLQRARLWAARSSSVSVTLSLQLSARRHNQAMDSLHTLMLRRQRRRHHRTSVCTRTLLRRARPPWLISCRTYCKRQIWRSLKKVQSITWPSWHSTSQVMCPFSSSSPTDCTKASWTLWSEKGWSRQTKRK